MDDETQWQEELADHELEIRVVGQKLNLQALSKVISDELLKNGDQSKIVSEKLELVEASTTAQVVETKSQPPHATRWDNG